MMKILALIVCVALLTGCSTVEETYDEVSQGCTMSGYVVIPHPSFYEGNFLCVSDMQKKEYEFKECTIMCDKLIDDNRDLSLTNSDTGSLGCLELCLGK